LRRKMRNVHFSLPEPNQASYFNYEMNDLNMAYNKLVNELHQLIETVRDKERLKNQAEIKMLQAQIHPHFLFNTLESLYWTLRDKQEIEGAELIINLSKLFRYSIKNSEGDDWTDLHHEVEHCRRYLEIMKFRLTDRLRWEIDMDPDMEHFKIPKLLLQPLVENAIQHGIEPKIKGGSIVLLLCKALRGSEDVLHVQVKDDGEGMTEEQVRYVKDALDKKHDLQTTGSGIGLSNVQARMKLYYGAGCELKLTSGKGTGTEVNLYLPGKELIKHDKIS
jgi:two-component system sensor histidine kinase YesM